MPPRRAVLLGNITPCHLYHFLTGVPLFPDATGGFGGQWPEYPFDEARCRAAWEAVKPLFLSWWQARYPTRTPWAVWRFDRGARGQWRRWEWDHQRDGRLLDVLREFLALYQAASATYGRH